MDDTANAFIEIFELEGAADGPLAGLTFCAKDIYDVAGHQTGCGSPDWAASHPIATSHAAPVAALLEAGARLVGKTHTDEIAYSLMGVNAHYGTPINTAAPDRIPGGSSSGSVAAVAAGLVDIGLGSDTGGSVRVPASFCGVFGLR
ncbi:MAG: amidase family protein, partial [Pseudomonadota bacterium]